MAMSILFYNVALILIIAFDTNADLDWWQTTVLYQVYPKSFKDNNGDGIGDLKGIESMAEYFNETGIGAIWLSPIFKSPMADAGYDISDYLQIDSSIGSLDDFISLQKKLKSLGIRLILDFVPNHSSDEHEWFKKSVQKIDPYTDYYVWLDGKVDTNGNLVPPNNWRNYFDGSAWEWSPIRKQYYLHQFTIKQPDFNYSSSALLNDMKNILRYWLDKGVDGFRVDALPFIVEHSSFKDEPLISSDTVDDNYSYFLLDHIYTTDQLDTYKIVEEFRAVLDEYTKRDGNTRLMLTEAYTSINYTMMYYSQETPRAHMPFNFNMILYLNKSSSAIDIKNVINMWIDNMPTGQWANWVIGNHDNKRIATRFSEDMVDPMNTLVMLLPGTAVTYNGEEIGLTDGLIRWDQTVDPWGKQAGIENYEMKSRDFSRTPFHWNNKQNAGFTTSKYTWLPVNSNYWYLNLESQKKSQRSHYQTYKKLAALRKLPTIISGNLIMYTPSEWILIFTRALEGHETFFVILNVGSEEEIITLRENFNNISPNMIVRASSINSYYEEEHVISTIQPLIMRSKSSIVLSEIPTTAVVIRRI